MRCCAGDEGLWPFGVVLRREASNRLMLRWLECRQRRRRCGRFRRRPEPSPRRADPGLPGRSSSARRTRRSWRGLLHGRPARQHPGSHPGRGRARDPADPHPRSYPASSGRADRPARTQPDRISRRPGGSGQVHVRKPCRSFPGTQQQCSAGAVLAALRLPGLPGARVGWGGSSRPPAPARQFAASYSSTIVAGILPRAVTL
jgi:hypothetical protein